MEHTTNRLIGWRKEVGWWGGGGGGGGCPHPTAALSLERVSIKAEESEVKRGKTSSGSMLGCLVRLHIDAKVCSRGLAY